MISAYIIITLCTGGDNEAAILAGGHVVFVGYQWEWGMKPGGMEFLTITIIA